LSKARHKPGVSEYPPAVLTAEIMARAAAVSRACPSKGVSGPACTIAGSWRCRVLSRSSARSAPSLALPSGSEHRINQRAGGRDQFVGRRQRMVRQPEESVRITRPVVVEDEAAARFYRNHVHATYRPPQRGLPRRFVFAARKVLLHIGEGLLSRKSLPIGSFATLSTLSK
jgi:hypothetical protein